MTEEKMYLVDEATRNRRRIKSKRLVSNPAVKEQIKMAEDVLTESGLIDVGSCYEITIYAEKALMDQGVSCSLKFGVMADDSFNFAMDRRPFPYYWLTSGDYIFDFNSGVYRPHKLIYSDRGAWIKRKGRDSKPLYEEYPSEGGYINGRRTNLVESHLRERLIDAFSDPKCKLDLDAVFQLQDAGVLSVDDVNLIQGANSH